jgi:hypothetical protein
MRSRSKKPLRLAAFYNLKRETIFELGTLVLARKSLLWNAADLRWIIHGETLKSIGTFLGRAPLGGVICGLKI